jgi:hypothetical protein
LRIVLCLVLSSGAPLVHGGGSDAAAAEVAAVLGIYCGRDPSAGANARFGAARVLPNGF